MKPTFTTINHEAQRKLGVTFAEYVLINLVHNLANSEKSTKDHDGWCYASRKFLAEEVGMTERGLIKMLKRLQEAGLILVNNKRHLRAFSGWVDATTLSAVPSDPVPSSPQTLSSVHTTYIKDIYKDKESQTSSSSARQAEEIVALYNKHFQDTFALRVTNNRTRKIGSRLAAPDGEEKLKQAIINASLSDFHRGKNDRGWHITLDWIIDSDEHVDKMANLKIIPKQPTNLFITGD